MFRRTAGSFKKKTFDVLLLIFLALYTRHLSASDQVPQNALTRNPVFLKETPANLIYTSKIHNHFLKEELKQTRIRQTINPFRVDKRGFIYYGERISQYEISSAESQKFVTHYYFPILHVGSFVEFSEDSIFSIAAALYSDDVPEQLTEIPLTTATTIPYKEISLGFLFLLSTMMFSGLIYWGWMSNKSPSRMLR